MAHNEHAAGMVALHDAVDAGWQLFDDPQKIADRYRTWSAAASVPRAIMYFDLGVLLGLIAELTDADFKLEPPS